MFPETTRRDEVLYYLGKAYLEDGQKARALEVLGQLTRDFPGSIHSADAGKLLSSLNKP